MKRYRRQFATLAFFAILLNAVVPFFAVYTTPHSASVEKTPSTIGNKVLLCTLEGFRWVKLADLKTGKSPVPNSHYKCPLCYLSVYGIAHETPLLEIVQPTAFTQLQFLSWRNTLIDFSVAAFLGSRAPPVFFA